MLCCVAQPLVLVRTASLLAHPCSCFPLSSFFFVSSAHPLLSSCQPAACYSDSSPCHGAEAHLQRPRHHVRLQCVLLGLADVIRGALPPAAHQPAGGKPATVLVAAVAVVPAPAGILVALGAQGTVDAHSEAGLALGKVIGQALVPGGHRLGGSHCKRGGERGDRAWGECGRLSKCCCQRPSQRMMPSPQPLTLTAGKGHESIEQSTWLHCAL